MSEHGRREWTGGCRCRVCVRWRRQYLAKLRAAGLRLPRRYDPAGPVVEHLAALTGAGMSVPQIVAATGVSEYAVRSLMAGGRRGVLPSTTQAVLAVPVPARPRDEFSGVGVSRRLRALAAMGWSQEDLAQRCGVEQTYLAQLASRPERSVVPATHRRVAALYAELAMRPGPSPRAALYAKRRGFPPPLAWDDESIDDPNAVPNVGARSGHVLTTVHVEDVEFMAEHGETWAAVITRTGVCHKTIDRALRRAGRGDVAARLTANGVTNPVASNQYRMYGQAS